MKFIIGLLLLSFVGCQDSPTETERIELITNKSERFCNNKNGVSLINFYFDALYGVVECKNGIIAQISPNSYVGK